MSQGTLLDWTGEELGLHIALCEAFLSLCEAHESLHTSLGDVLQRIATSKDGEARSLADQLHGLAVRGTRMEDGIGSWIVEMAARLRAGITDGKKIQLFSDFSDATQLGICLLLRLLVDMAPESRIGGGHLLDPAQYQHLASGQNVVGFTSMALTSLLQKAKETQLVTPRRSLGGFLGVLIIAFLIAITGWLVADSFRTSLERSERKLEGAIERMHSDLKPFLKKVPAIGIPTSPPQTETATRDLQNLIQQVFKKDTRDGALALMRQEHAGAVKEVVDRLERSLTETTDDSRWGVVYLLRFLEAANMDQLLAQRDRINKLLTEVKTLKRPKATEAAERVSKRLNTNQQRE
jgi:hypothetical protein